MRALHDRLETQKGKLDANVAEGDAEWAEADAEDALSFARWAIDSAAVTVLGAVKMRLRANAQMAGRS